MNPQSVFTFLVIPDYNLEIGINEHHTHKKGISGIKNFWIYLEKQSHHLPEFNFFLQNFDCMETNYFLNFNKFRISSDDILMCSGLLLL